MGTDITLHVEYRDNDALNRWYSGDLFRMDRTRIGFTRVPLYDDRCYALFAVLANVRNYGDTKYIDDPRGLPDDVCDFIKQQYNDDWGYGCSHFTLQELIDFHNQKHPLKRSGMLSPKQIEELDNGILPDHWCQGTGDPSYERRYWEEENHILEPLIEKLKARADDLRIIPEYYWDSDRDYCKEFVRERSADIRIVFWFDC